MRRADFSRDLEISSVLHEINNMLCTIRLHASCISGDPALQESAKELLEASRSIETQVSTLAGFAKRSCQREVSQQSTEGSVKRTRL